MIAPESQGHESQRQVFHCANNFFYHHKRHLLCMIKDLMEWSAPLPKRLQMSHNRMSLAGHHSK